MRNLVSVICFAIVCFLTTGCGGGGGGGNGISDPPPGTITLHGNVKVDADVPEIKNPVVTLVRLPSFVGADQTRVIVSQARINDMKVGGPVTPYELKVPSDAPIGRYEIVLYNHAGQMAEDGRDYSEEMCGHFANTVLHLPKNWDGYATKADFWACSTKDPGPAMLPSNVNIIVFDATSISTDFVISKRRVIEY